jgi:DNA polymerase elongation subunit (family B)
MAEAPIVTTQVVPYDVIVADDVMNEDTGDNHVNIHLWCLDKESKPWLVRVRDFPAYFYIELPTIVNGSSFAWDTSSAEKVIDSLKFMMGDKAPVNWMFGQWQKLYYYMGNRKFPMIFVSFKTLEAVRFCTNLLSKPRNIRSIGTIQMKCYEANIDIIRKFFTSRDANFCQWLNVTGHEFDMDHDGRIAKEGHPDRPIRELSVSYTNVKPIDQKETDSWFTNPRILAFDIETYSDNHKAMPNPLVSKHVCNIISLIYYELGNVESRKRYVIVLGDSNEIGDDIVVIRVQNETELITAFGNLVNELDPEIVSGYNIFAYDYPFLNTRRKHKMIDWPIMGRLQKKPTEMSQMIWKSGAYGTQDINILEMEGRMSIDMLPIVKRDYRLDKYSLEFVSQNFLGRGKLDVKPVDMFRAYERQEFVIRYAKNFIMMRTGNSVKNWDILAKLNELKESSESSCSDIEEINKIIARYTLAIDEVTKIVAYCVQDSDLVVDLFDKLNVWIGLNALSSVVGVTIIQLFTRGQQVRCLSQVYDKASRKGVILDKRIKDKVFYEGGFVFEPKSGLYDGVICLDFASLYPSIMRAMNICFTTLVPPELYDSVPDADCNIIDVNQEETAANKGLDSKGNKKSEEASDDSDSDDENIASEGAVFKTYHYKWVKKNVRYGILPEIQDHLVGSRNVIKKEIAELEDELDECEDPKRLAQIKLLLVLKDKYSNALKVSANSLYGFLGAQEGGVLALIEAAMCITATGRKLINQVNDYVIQKYGAEIVYGDSVTGDTALFIQDTQGNQNVVRIDELVKDFSLGIWKKYRDSKEIIDMETMNISVMTETGFTKIKKFIRHKLHKDKKLYRIITKSGTVDVTEDHSLILSNGKEISPKDVKIGTELLHNFEQSKYIKHISLEGKEGKVLEHIQYLQSINLNFTNDGNEIVSIEEILFENENDKINTYVYDLETENHHFAVGPGALVVHNTDSSMIDLHIRDPKACFEAGVKLAEEISGTPEKKLADGTIIPAKPGLFPPPLKMEFEKAMRMLSLKKKKYLALLIGKDGEYVREKNKDGTLGEYKILKRGVIVARRDTCKLVHRTYNELVYNILTRTNIKESFDILFNMVDDLINDRIPVRGNLSIIRSIGDSYKSDNYFMKVFSDELTKSGNMQSAGSRVDYVILRTKAEEEGAKDVKLGLKMRLLEMYEDAWNIKDNDDNKATSKSIDPKFLFDHPDDPLKIVEENVSLYPPEKPDVNYYLEHIIQSSLDQAFECSYKSTYQNLVEKGYSPQFSRKKSTPAINPIKLINAIFEDYMKAGYTMDQIKTMMPEIRNFFYKCIDSV